jgi:altronate hydrolase
VVTDGYLQVHPHDDLLVALRDQPAGARVDWNGHSFELAQHIPAKQKLALRDIAAGERVRMYGITVGKAVHPLARGGLITTQNLAHATDAAKGDALVAYSWQPPDVSRWREATFAGFRRSDGRVGTRNYWLVVPLVFCENRNIRTMRRAMLDELGYGLGGQYQLHTRRLVEQYRAGRTAEEIASGPSAELAPSEQAARVFPNVDGVRFLTHVEGCGGAYEDAKNLCGLLAGYIAHPNVAGATVLSLGCQKSEVALLEGEIHKRSPKFDKPLYVFEQQKLGTVETLMERAIRHTFAGLVGAQACRREPARLAELTFGVECGGSDGFSGISANPAIGRSSDLLVALGGSSILSEFPELAGCENDLASRCTDRAAAERFLHLMSAYEKRLLLEGNDFGSNPSPGNVRDGLITDAMKSAGAARKGGTAPVADVLDYPEPVTRPGLNLLCTPGGDVESTTALVGSGANIVAFSTGLGTPMGNAIAPVIKVSSNTELAQRMPDIIDLDTGGIIRGKESIEEAGARLFDLILRTASGDSLTKAEQNGQEDFAPWRRCLSF